MLFFSDLHVRPQTNLSFVTHFTAWRGLNKIQDQLVKACEEFQPDYLLFGGDLLAFMSYYPEVVRLFRAMKPKRKTRGVRQLGQMRPWVPSREWKTDWGPLP